MGHVRLRHAGFTSVHAEKGLQKVSASLKTLRMVYPRSESPYPLHQNIIGSFQMVTQSHLMSCQDLGCMPLRPQNSESGRKAVSLQLECLAFTISYYFSELAKNTAGTLP